MLHSNGFSDQTLENGQLVEHLSIVGCNKLEERGDEYMS
jgi:hypothetical protein